MIIYATRQTVKRYQIKMPEEFSQESDSIIDGKKDYVFAGEPFKEMVLARN